ncbi:hypothetical protein [uncultured Helicobacter sp.]|uniref:hypothetical protein n=1 Tax=uncultured Helicobacter sp. TaxID=175537 RepID=UPI002622A727|nr:hypothetical protein [uncultured Helicobacter sp.]
MKFLLINTNQIVQKLVEITAKKAGVELKIITESSQLKDLKYDYAIVDDDCLLLDKTTYLEALKDTRKCLVYNKGAKRIDGFDDYVQKPFLPTTILEIITSQLSCNVHIDDGAHNVSHQASADITLNTLDDDLNKIDSLLADSDDLLLPNEESPAEETLTESLDILGNTTNTLEEAGTAENEGLDIENLSNEVSNTSLEDTELDLSSLDELDNISDDIALDTNLDTNEETEAKEESTDVLDLESSTMENIALDESLDNLDEEALEKETDATIDEEKVEKDGDESLDDIALDVEDNQKLEKVEDSQLAPNNEQSEETMADITESSPDNIEDMTEMAQDDTAQTESSESLDELDNISDDIALDTNLDTNEETEAKEESTDVLDLESSTMENIALDESLDNLDEEALEKETDATIDEEKVEKDGDESLDDVSADTEDMDINNILGQTQPNEELLGDGDFTNDLLNDVESIPLDDVLSSESTNEPVLDKEQINEVSLALNALDSAVPNNELEDFSSLKEPEVAFALGEELDFPQEEDIEEPIEEEFADFESSLTEAQDEAIAPAQPQAQSKEAASSQEFVKNIITNSVQSSISSLQADDFKSMLDGLEVTINISFKDKNK